MNGLNKWLNFGKGLGSGSSTMSSGFNEMRSGLGMNDWGNFGGTNELGMGDWSNFNGANELNGVSLGGSMVDTGGLKITPSFMEAPTGAFGKISEFAAKNAPLMNFGIGAVTGIAQGIQGYKMNKMYKQGMKNQMEQWNKQYNMNRQMTNNQLSERAQRAYAARGNTGVNPEEYMKKWGV